MSVFEFLPGIMSVFVAVVAIIAVYRMKAFRPQEGPLQEATGAVADTVDGDSGDSRYALLQEYSGQGPQAEADADRR